MELQSYFADFLKEIRLSDKKDFIEAHKALRELLEKDEDLEKIFIHSFLQGSYRRATAIKPFEGTRPDVDVVVVTSIPMASTSPADAMAIFEPFLEAHYKDQWHYQDRSFRIDNGKVEMDLVVTAAPSMEEQKLLLSELFRSDFTLEDVLERSVTQFAASLKLSEYERKAADDPWRSEPLHIPDRARQQWSPTDPLAQIAWTQEKNSLTNGHYVNVVKAIKWWWREKHPGLKYPKGYPLEHIVGANCPDGISSVAAGIVQTLEMIVLQYAWYRANNLVPVLTDHGVSQDVLHRLSAGDFAHFFDAVKDAAALARAAYDESSRGASSRLWNDLLGNPFPRDEEAEEEASRTLAGAPAVVQRERFGDQSGRYA